MLGLCVFAAVLLSTGPAFSFDYCQITCNGAEHTMCAYPVGGPGRCGSFRGGLRVGEKQLILDLHNEMRQRVATGRERRGSQPPAGDMGQLGWDREAEAVAQRWADQCDDKGHGRCRRSRPGREVGQNIAWTRQYSTGAKLSREEAIRRMVWAWYDEVAVFRGSVDRYESDSKTGHYSQLVWATTAGVGCGLAELRDGHASEFKLVCNYTPAGNWIGAPIYAAGTPCSACPRGASCSPAWHGLCAY